jgi:glyceraldehyde-3-phosphate dehydrogenase (ferredoxin)
MESPLVQFAMLVDVSNGSHELRELDAADVLGPVDFGLRMQSEGDFLCIGSGILAGGIIPGSNRLVFTGHSPVWGGFYVSTMGGAGLLWDGIGISFLAISGRAERPSVMVLSGVDGCFPKVRLVAIEPEKIWGRRDNAEGFYALQKHVFCEIWDGQGTPRVLSVGPAALHTAMGAIGSSRTAAGKLTPVDCWAGRGGFGSRMLQNHNLCAIVYGGDFEDEDLTDRAEADGYFEKKFHKKMLMEDLEATTKYRYDPKWKSGGTFGVNFSSLADLMLSFNYRSCGWSREKRHALWEQLVRDHYLKQFNQETIEKKQFSHCGEPCPAVCKKLKDEFKKDYEPYETMGPQIGVFDQRFAEQVNHKADALGFDAIQIGGQLAWIMECLQDGIVNKESLGLNGSVPDRPVFSSDHFDPVRDSEINGRLALALLDLCVKPGHILSVGMRTAARHFGHEAQKRAVYLSNGDAGWMVPNQYWAPGMWAPMPIMGKYYVYYGYDFHSPRELGKRCVDRMVAELTVDNAGVCRFHRGWAESLWPEIVAGHHHLSIDYPAHHAKLACLIQRQGRPGVWECERLVELLHGYLQVAKEEDPKSQEIDAWLSRFASDRLGAAREYQAQLKQGIEERFLELGHES